MSARRLAPGCWAVRCKATGTTHLVRADSGCAAICAVLARGLGGAA